MRCPTLKELPPPPTGKTGWPWTEESIQLPDKMPDGSSWPKISIVTPSLNQGKFIEETIRSVLLQGYPNLEYIIIDGGSTDDSVQIIKKYEKWLCYWVSECDKGQAQAINKGFKMASGDIVAWLNSDDFYEKSIMSIVANYLCLHNDADFIYGDLNCIDRNGKTNNIFEPSNFNLIQLLYYDFIPQQSCFWRHSVLEDMGLLAESYNYIMDYEYWLRCAIKKSFLYVPVALANSRSHIASKSIAEPLEFLKESVQMFTSYFADTASTRNEILLHRNRVLEHWNERLALKYFDMKLMKEARNHFLISISLTPRRFQSFTLLAYIVDTLIGSNLGRNVQLIGKKLREK